MKAEKLLEVSTKRRGETGLYQMPLANLFKDYLTENEIVDRFLRDCPSLRTSYQLYQNLLYAVKKREIETFKNI